MCSVRARLYAALLQQKRACRVIDMHRIAGRLSCTCLLAHCLLACLPACTCTGWLAGGLCWAVLEWAGCIPSPCHVMYPFDPAFWPHFAENNGNWDMGERELLLPPPPPSSSLPYTCTCTCTHMDGRTDRWSACMRGTAHSPQQRTWYVFHLRHSMYEVSACVCYYLFWPLPVMPIKQIKIATGSFGYGALVCVCVKEIVK